MMFCVKYVGRKNNLKSFNVAYQAFYSRRSSDNNTTLYKIINANGESIDATDNGEFETNNNWELLTPRGFRFYLPGSIGPGWVNSSTTTHIKTEFITITQKDSNNVNVKKDANTVNVKKNYKRLKKKSYMKRPLLHCTAQECPLLLRKGIEELFSGCLDVSAAQLTIVTISQKSDFKTLRWSKITETEKLAKYFVLAASDICTRLKMIGYWADFINPFSGQPYFSSLKTNTLYTTDERFRCLGFKIKDKNNCKIITYDNNVSNFIGSLYTTAPASMEFLKEIMSNINTEF
ncbi:methylmalonic aciduria and homocystinuria type D homolog, mitochondrial-like isoform X1 [Vespa mandarinia]|uniref:methylmalonic aciduria and homocystinuria type D homolog, mitochondrial-like isoform X1 n=2 Tax=Vespa mandarinia TaxID=7446 RepID=UPI0016109251|nr:methylmalonic aciduria and homocystinuria type D homolog, mitochondrial-like isoform X1 [Vespa mandarinia]XP_035726075.1 methylmalonic aciduria and homocystinuria type D homolog, mitochondrial-like isoform X1 [Vespa mandarinia]XP_035726076.1 methylmalonic aciduria and homocystinuria type D homolog, mitochondrial-like isoform X1 [Vespa mandarinia]